MTAETGIGLFVLGMIVTPVFMYYLFKFMEHTEGKDQEDESRF